MDARKPNLVKLAEELQVPGELLQQLHAANARLHETRAMLERSMDDSEEGHQHRIDQATTELNAAEKALEEISLKVHHSLKPPPPAGPGSGNEPPDV